MFKKQVEPAKPGEDGGEGVLVALPRLQPLRDLLVLHQVVSREPIRFADEDNAPAPADPGLEGAPAEFAQAKPAVAVRVAKVPGYQRELFLNLAYDLVAELAG